MPLIPAFQLRLRNTILPNLACVGKYDGRHPSLTCATSAGKIFVHSPHLQSSDEGDVRFLNINQQITAMAAGSLSPNPTKDTLFVGTPTNLLVYDVQENSDVYYKEVEDGVNVLVLGAPLPSRPDHRLVIVGGNANIQGFDHTGAEAFWSVTGDNITAMTLCDVDGDGRDELVVASEDCDLRVFRGDNVVADIPEADVVTALCPLRPGAFGYALANGTVGQYVGASPKRSWRVKNRNTPMCMGSFDLDCDGVPELVVGWESGRLEVRSDKGELVFKDQFSTAVSALTAADYRMDGKQELIVCALDGEIRGFLGAKPGPQGTLLDKNVMEETLASLSQKKQQLQFELQHFEETAKAQAAAAAEASSSSPSSSSAVEGAREAAPAEFKSSVKVSPEVPNVQLCLSAPPALRIHGVVVSGDQQQSSMFVRPKELSCSLVVALAPSKNLPEELQVRTMVGPQNSESFLVMETALRLPKFAMYARVATTERKPAPSGCSYVTFKITERVARVWLWLRQSFIFPEQVGGEATIDISFVGLRDKGLLQINLADSVMTIRTEDLELAGDIVQDLCEYLKISELDSKASFPREAENFRQIVTSVGEYNSARMKLSAELADSSNLIKTLLVKAEDSRLLGDMRRARQTYTTLYEVNRELVQEYRKRESNQAALMKSLKEMNQAIQRAARLRSGTHKSKIIMESREAVVANNIDSLFKIVSLAPS